MPWLRRPPRTTRLSSSIALCGMAPAKSGGGRPVEAAENVRRRQAMELVQRVEQGDQGIVVAHSRLADTDRLADHAASTSRSDVAAKPKAS